MRNRIPPLGTTPPPRRLRFRDGSCEGSVGYGIAKTRAASGRSFRRAGLEPDFGATEWTGTAAERTSGEPHPALRRATACTVLRTTAATPRAAAAAPVAQ